MPRAMHGDFWFEFRLTTSIVFYICPRPGLFPVLGPLEWYMTPTLDLALLCSSKAGSDLGRTLDW